MIIDVSIHNGIIDWQKVKGAGVTGAIVRCGYGRDMTKQDDANFYRNMDGALAAGLDVGIYIYSYAKSIDSAKSEAQHALRLASRYKNKLAFPIYYDLEEPGTETGAIERANAFGDIIEAAGYWCGVYASLYWWNNHLKGLNRFTKWVAAWGSNNGKPGTKPNINGTDVWQYTSNGHIAGINGRVDCNEVLRDLPALIKGNAAAPTPAPAPIPAPVPTPTPAPATDPTPTYIKYKIKKGDTLSAIAKKYNTTVAKIKAANPGKIKNVNKIYAGDVINIPE